MTNEIQTRLFKMTASEACDTLYQNELVPLFGNKKVARPDKFRLVRLFVELKQSISKGVARAGLETQYKALVKYVNELKGGLDGKRK